LSTNIGAIKLSNISQTLDDTQDKNLLIKFYTELNLVMKELETLESENQDRGDFLIDLDLSKKDELFIFLKEALQTNKPKRCEPILEEIGKYKLLSEDKKLFNRVKQLIKQYKFKEAVKLFDEK